MKRTRAERLLVAIAGDDIAEEMIGSVESERIEMKEGGKEYASQWKVSHVSHQQ